MGIAVAQVGALVAQQLHHCHRGRLAHVVDVLLVGDAEDQDLATAYGLAAVVEGVGELGDDPARHVGVDLAGELDEAGVEPVRPRLPGEVEGVDGDAVAAQPRAGVVGHEAEGLGGRSVDHLVDIDPHAVGDDLHLVDQADVHRAVDVLQQLGHLRRARAAHGHHLIDDGAVERHAGIQAGLGDAAADLGDGARGVARVGGILALRGVGQEEILAHGEPRARLQARPQLLLRRAGVGGALQGDDLAGAQVGREGLGGAQDVGEVRLAVVVERRGDAEDQRIDLRGAGGVGGGLEALRARLADRLLAQVRNGALAVVEGRHLLGVDVEAEDPEAFLNEAEHQGQADVAEADDADARLSLLELPGNWVVVHACIRCEARVDRAGDGQMRTTVKRLIASGGDRRPRRLL